MAATESQNWSNFCQKTIFRVYFEQIVTIVQVNNYEIVVNFFHISHNLTWYSVKLSIDLPEFTQFVQLMN